MQLSAIIRHFAVHESFLVFQNFCHWDLPVSILVHFFDEVKGLLMTGKQIKWI